VFHVWDAEGGRRGVLLSCPFAADDYSEFGGKSAGYSLADILHEITMASVQIVPDTIVQRTERTLKRCEMIDLGTTHIVQDIMSSPTILIIRVDLIDGIVDIISTQRRETLFRADLICRNQGRFGIGVLPDQRVKARVSSGLTRHFLSCGNRIFTNRIYYTPDHCT